MAGKSRSTDGDLMRGYSVRCAMPGCTNFRALNSNVLNGKATKKRAVRKLRSEGWSDRDVIGWTCGQHDGRERRKVKREEESPDASEYGFEHA